MPEVREAPVCLGCGELFKPRERQFTCYCGDAPFHRACEDEHFCGADGCRRCGSAVMDDREGPWCSPCRAEVAGGVDIDLDQGGPVKVLSHGLHGPRAAELGGPQWLVDSAESLEGLAGRLREVAAALSLADAPRAMAMAVMGEGLPAAWNDRKEAVEIRGLDPAVARQLALDHDWILKGPGFTPTEWEQMRAKEAARA